ncbi:YjzD family protein [Dellaglioa sp. BT-FLS60]
MMKQLTILFWGFIFGEVIGYIVSSLTGTTFAPVLLIGIVFAVTGLIAVNCLYAIIKDPKSDK